MPQQTKEKLFEIMANSGLNDKLTCIQQITYLLFLKIIDDQELVREKNANLLGVTLENPLFDAEHQNCRWSVFKQYNSQDLFANMRDKVFPFINEELPKKTDASALQKSMKNAVFMHTQPNALTQLVDVIDKLNFNDKNFIKNLYECVIKDLPVEVQSGRLRTPRHIIDMMVSLMKPTLDDTILDPAMGTAGFVCSEAKYVMQNNQANLMDVSKKNHFNNTMFNGADADPAMFSIGAMNLFLHGVEAKNIQRLNSLSPDTIARDSYSLILTNPPFSGSVDESDVAKDLRSNAKTKKTELLFLQLNLKALAIGGRCATIVPDGVLFGTSAAAFQNIRKDLVENQRLQAVISMPGGVFKPDSDSSTAILIFTKTNTGGTDKVWFYDMSADGFTLDDKRTPCEENDIPDILSRWENLAAEESRTRKDKSFFVSIDDIRANGYDLSINKYKEVERVRVEYENPSVILDRIQNLHDEVASAIKEYREKYL